jgi:adenine deaminase
MQILCIVEGVREDKRKPFNLFLSIIAGFSAINHASLSHAKVYGIGALGAYLLGSTARTILLSESAEMADWRIYTSAKDDKSGGRFAK